MQSTTYALYSNSNSRILHILSCIPSTFVGLNKDEIRIGTSTSTTRQSSVVIYPGTELV